VLRVLSDILKNYSKNQFGFLRKVKLKMKIGIDARLINGQRRGMGNVLYNILKTLDTKIDSEIILYFDRNLDPGLLEELINTKYKITIIKNKNYIIWEQFLLPLKVKKDDVDVFWHPYNTGSLIFSAVQVLSIHDVMFMKSRKILPYSRNIYQILGRFYRRYITPKIALKSKEIITISHHAKKDINKEIKLDHDKIHVVFNGCSKNLNKEFRNEDWRIFKEKHGIDNEYIFTLGAIEPRKNTVFTIEVFAEFVKRNNLSTILVISGIKNWKDSSAFQKSKDLKIEKQVVFLSYVSDDYLDLLYINATLFLFLSYYEGFGLPVLESMALMTPVLTTNVTSMPEVAGNAAFFTSHIDFEETTKNLTELYFNKELQEKYIKLGIERVKYFTWDVTTSKVANILLKTMHKPVE